MTITYQSDVICIVCGHSSKQTNIGSSGQYEAPDLDTRPGRIYRYSMQYWVSKCPQCGYCNSRLDKAPDGIEEIINSNRYKEILAGASGFHLAVAFTAQAYIYETLGDLPLAIWAQIHAAWAWDDGRIEGAATECRLKAYELLKKLWAEDKILLENKASDYALAADLFRRSCKLNVFEMVDKGLNSDPDDFTRKLLMAEKIFYIRLWIIILLPHLEQNLKFSLSGAAQKLQYFAITNDLVLSVISLFIFSSAIF